MLAGFLNIEMDKLEPFDLLSITTICLCDPEFGNRSKMPHLSKPLLAIDSISFLCFYNLTIIISQCKSKETARIVTDLYLSEVALLTSELFGTGVDATEKQILNRVAFFQQLTKNPDDILNEIFNSFIRLLVWESGNSKYEPVHGYLPMTLLGVDNEINYRSSVLSWLKQAQIVFKTPLQEVERYIITLS